MTKQEFEALLLKKGFDNEVEESTFCQTLQSYGDNILEARFDCSLDYEVDFIIVAYGVFNDIAHISLFYDTITEQKLDEILAQCTKIKTALEMINQTVKGE